MFKKSLALILALTLCLAVFAGCGGGETETPPPEKETAPDTENTDAPKEGTASDVFVWNLGADPRTWDPALNNASDGGHIINNLFEGLMRDMGGGKLDYAMAESHTVSEDGKTYTFILKDGLKWSDGTPLTAKDFEYSWKRVCDPKTASEYSFIMAPYIKGAEAFLRDEGTADDMGVKAVDDKTLVVELNFPVPYFLALTTFYTYLPTNEAAVAKGDGWEKNPETCISNGPFKLSEYKTASHIDFVKNENYWDAANVKLEKLHGLMIVEATTAFNGYKSGEIALLDTVPLNEIPNLQASDPYFSIKDRVGTYYAVFNVDKAPFDDVRVRKAFTLAIDQKKVTEVTKGGQKPATGFIPPSLKFSDGSSCRKLDENGMPLPEYGIDPMRAQADEAKALLKEYMDEKGMTEFPAIDYYYNTQEAHKAIAETLQEMWKTNLGIEIGLKNEEWAVFQDTRRLGNTLIARAGWLGDYDDPMTMLDLFTSYSGNNDAQWRWQEEPIVAAHDKTLNPSNKAFDEAIEKIQLTTGTERDEWIRKAEQIMMDECIILPIYYYTYVQIVDESVIEGVTRTTMGHWNFKDAEMVA